jgi:type IX secretion system PorP/SprF family membrane protein
VSYSQDVHFTQFDAAAITLNPAFTGDINGFWRFSNTYRTQWRTFGNPYTTFSSALDAKIWKKNPIGLGFLILRDNTADNQLNLTKIYGSIAIHLKTRNGSIQFGLQPGTIAKNLKVDNFTFASQYDSDIGYIDDRIDDRENFSQFKKTVFDINAGAVYRVRNGKSFGKFGLAMYHLTKPSQSLLGSANLIPMRTVLHGSYAVMLSKTVAFIPKTLVMLQSKAQEYTIGSYLSFTSLGAKSSTLLMGLMSRTGIGRNTDAVSLTLGLSQRNWDISVNYDFNISDLNETGTTGAFEWVFIYWSGTGKIKKKNILCERF